MVSSWLWPRLLVSYSTIGAGLVLGLTISFGSISGFGCWCRVNFRIWLLVSGQFRDLTAGVGLVLGFSCWCQVSSKTGYWCRVDSGL